MVVGCGAECSGGVVGYDGAAVAVVNCDIAVDCGGCGMGIRDCGTAVVGCETAVVSCGRGTLYFGVEVGYAPRTLSGHQLLLQ